VLNATGLIDTNESTREATMSTSHPHPLHSSRMSMLASCLLAALAGFSTVHAEDSIAAGKAVLEPGVATFANQQSVESFGNAAIEAGWKLDGKHLVDMTVTDRVHGRTLAVPMPFALVLADGSTLKASDMRLLSPPRALSLPVDAKAAQLAARIPGKVVEASFGDANGRFRVDWRLVQRDGSPYLREEVSITALKQDEEITKVSLLETQVADAEVVGDVNGSPVVAGDVYMGFENPLSGSEVRGDNVRLTMPRKLPLGHGKTVAYSAVVGVVRDGQLRRDFDIYVERQRAHPYRPFLHYNSWYDIGYFNPYTQAEALNRINTIGEELHVKRGVKLDSFLFDDGWDDYSGSWNFSKNFPDGFVPLRKAAAKYGAAPGIWLSPWGGYGKPWKERVKNGKAAGYETNAGGFELSGPKYYQRFHDVVMQLLNKDGINQFKFDGTGNVSSVFPGSRFDSDFAAAIQLIDDIRKDKPDTFINLTTGTWASPFWLRYADTIWRDGYDDSETGVGATREQWITYRDQQTYQNIVLKGPLFPINSLMLHGIIYAQKNRKLNTDPGHDFANEVHSYFATGTELQEMYITPSLLSKDNWDVLAESANWSRANAEVLRDTHWIGGDPGRLDVYGWASWSPGKSIITLRNPSDHAQLAVVDLQRQLELPAGAARRFNAHSPWKSDATEPGLTLDADKPDTITLAPFEVLTLELTPVVAGS